MTVWQQARSHFFAKLFGRRFIGEGEGEGEDEGEDDDARAVILSA